MTAQALNGNAHANNETASGTTGTVYYTKENTSEPLYSHVYKREPLQTPGSQQDETSNIERIETHVKITDLRPLAESFSLKQNGFILRKFIVPRNIDWSSKEEVATKYYPLVQELIKRETGATGVHIFDHTLRSGHVSSENEEDILGKVTRQPVGLVHVDYTVEGGPNRLNLLYPEEAKDLSKKPFAIVQVWRPLKGPVESSPLGIIDAATVESNDYIPYTIYFPGRVGYNYALKASPKHRWYYAKGIEVDEAYVFVCYDSRKDRARFTPHTGFRDHSAGPDAAQRESIEIRSLCFFDNEPSQEPAMAL